MDISTSGPLPSVNVTISLPPPEGCGKVAWPDAAAKAAPTPCGKEANQCRAVRGLQNPEAVGAGEEDVAELLFLLDGRAGHRCEDCWALAAQRWMWHGESYNALKHPRRR